MRDRERSPVELKGPKRWFHDARLLYSSVAEKLTPPAYVAWSLWLIATGVVLL